jgi:antitoxin VbhA-like protein
MTDKETLSTAEIAKRREAFRRALANDRLEGIAHDPATDPIFEAWILGEIDSNELLARIKAYLHL